MRGEQEFAILQQPVFNSTVSHQSVQSVTAVIPAHNAGTTLRVCLESVCSIQERDGTRLQEIVVVSDHSTDQTDAISEEFNVTLLQSQQRGPAAARNLGYQHAQTEFIWFIDADCIARADALEHLCARVTDHRLGGVSGAYENALPESLLATLIDTEIAVRHARMGDRVDFLATFNVLYRKQALVEVGGFDPRYRKGQDAELSFRVKGAGYHLGFTRDSIVAHHHETQLGKYLKTQRQQGYWRYYLHTEHAGHSTGDSYSSLSDHLQPPLALCVAVLLPTTVVWGAISAYPNFLWLTVTVAAVLMLIALVLLQAPMTLSVVRTCGRPIALLFAPMSLIRALWRGVGFVHAALVSPFNGR